MNYIDCNDVNFISNFFLNKLNHGLIVDKNKLVTFNNKIKWISFFDITYLKVKCVDKIKLHEYCLEKIGKDICVPILEIYDDVNDIDINKLDDEFIIKCNHGCGYNILVKNKHKINNDYIRNKISNFLKEDYSLKRYELQYHFIDPKCYREKILKNIQEYKFYCINGIVDHFYVDDGNIAVYDLEFNPVNFRKDEFRFKYSHKKTYLFDEMIEICKLISKDFNFVRIDFFCSDDTIYLNELTFTPTNGHYPFKNYDFDKYYGEKLII